MCETGQEQTKETRERLNFGAKDLPYPDGAVGQEVEKTGGAGSAGSGRRVLARSVRFGVRQFVFVRDRLLCERRPTPRASIFREISSLSCFLTGDRDSRGVCRAFRRTFSQCFLSKSFRSILFLNLFYAVQCDICF